MTSPQYDRLSSGYYNNNLMSGANPGGLAGTGAVRKNFFALVADLCTIVAEAAASAASALTNANAATAAATSAVNAPGTNGTSITNMAISPTGTVLNPVLSAGKAWVSGMTVTLSSTAGAQNRMICRLDSYNAANGASQVTVLSPEGAGAFASWNVSLSSAPLNTTTDTLNVTKDMKLTGEITPAQITAITNDWNPAGIATATIVRASTDANRFVNGIVGGVAGRVLVLENVGAQVLSLGHENAGSVAANRFHLSAGADVQLPADRAVILVYDATLARWRDVGGLFLARSASDIWAATSTAIGISPATLFGSASFQTLTYAGTVAWDTAVKGFNAKVTLAGNGIIGAPTSLQDGVCYCLMLIQDATGGRVPTWNGIWDFGAFGTPTLQTGAGKVDFVFAIYDASAGKLRASFWKGI